MNETQVKVSIECMAMFESNTSGTKAIVCYHWIINKMEACDSLRVPPY